MKQIDLYLKCIALGAGILITLSIVKITPLLGVVFIIASCKEIYKVINADKLNFLKIIECAMVTILFISTFIIVFSNSSLFVSYFFAIISFFILLLYFFFKKIK